MTRPAGIIALGASLLGLLFASYSTFDYAEHLDRRLHDIHCSLIPGAAPTDAADACRAAMYSPYSALLRERYWGGIPISLFAVGAFAFFAAFALYLVIAGDRAPRQAVKFQAGASLAPLGASILMFSISLTKLGTFCLVCVGIYLSSILLAIGGVVGLVSLQREPRAAAPAPGSPYARPETSGAAARPEVPLTHPIAWLVALGLSSLLPAVAYASAMPDHRPHLGSCGELKVKTEPSGSLVKIVSPRSTLPATLFEDPLCPTCRAFHARLLGEDVFDRLNVELALFPLDSECNWMLTDPLHPGACQVARAVICGGPKARDVLEWAYEEQDELSRAGKAGKPQIRAAIGQRWGQELLACLDAKSTTATLNRHLHFAVDNSIPISTPQVYLSGKRFCDEDTDIGLRFTLAQLAPEVLR